MKVYLDCYPCFLRQALDAARLARADVLQHVHVLYAVKGVFLATNQVSGYCLRRGRASQEHCV